MLYLIKDKYYMLRNREYVQVDITLNGNEFSIKPNRKNVIEANSNVEAKEVLIDKVMEELRKKDKTNHNDSEQNNKYGM